MLSARRDVGMLQPTVWLLKRAYISAKHLTWRIVDVTVAGVIRTTLSDGVFDSGLVDSLIEYLNSVNAGILSTRIHSSPWTLPRSRMKLTAAGASDNPLPCSCAGIQ
jgi:hypothetical protein